MAHFGILAPEAQNHSAKRRKWDGLRPAPDYHLLSTAEFSIWTREAGAGGLSIAVEGPSKAEIAFEDHKDGSCGVSYTAQEPGMKLKH